MKKRILLFALMFLLAINFVSASLCRDDYGYYRDCNSINDYNKNNKDYYNRDYQDDYYNDRNYRNLNYYDNSYNRRNYQDSYSDKYNYYIDCNGVSDGFCPQNYSKNIWVDNVACPTVNVGKCYPCDPDCGTCPKIELVVTPYAEICGDIRIKASVNTDRGNMHVFNSFYPSHSFDLVNCNKIENHNGSWSNPCTASYIDVYSANQNTGNSGLCSPGFYYCYEALMQSGDLQGQDVISCGYVKPKVNLTLTPDRAPGYVYDASVDSSVLISATAISSAKIRDLKIKVSRWSNKIGSVGFYPIHMEATSEDYCSFRCPGNVCAPLISDPSLATNPKSPATVSNNFLISKCENGVYRIAGEADDGQSIGNATKDIVITNSDECTDECPIFTSKTLNTVVAKVKTWINPS